MTQQQAFLLDYLGQTANTPPSAAFGATLRKHLLSTPLAQPVDAGAQSSPRNVPGIFPDAYAVHHKLVTPEEMVPRWDAFLAYERDHRGLPEGHELILPKSVVFKVTHFTVTQHLVIGALHPVPAQRKLALQQAQALISLVGLQKPVADGPFTGPVRALGWCGRGLSLWHLAVGANIQSAMGVAELLARLDAAHGTEAGVPYLWRNPNALKDKNHLYECSPWMDSTNGDWLARATKAGSATARGLLLHLLRCLHYAQAENGTFHDDYQPGQPGVFHDAPGESTETWIWPALASAKEALDDEWPSWAETLLHRCEDRWLALNRFRPGDSGFKDMATQSIAIAMAPLWGFRE